MTTSPSPRVAALLLLAWLVPKPAHGQADPEAVKRRDNCRLAVQVIETGHPSSHQERAWQYIAVCDPAQRVRVYLSAMQQARTSADIPFIRQAILPAAGLHDRALLETTLSIAGDRTASVSARVVSFMALASILDPQASPTYEGFAGGLDEYGLSRGGCSRRLAHPAESIQGPLAFPPDYRRRIVEVAERVARDSSEAADVRSAAACV